MSDYPSGAANDSKAPYNQSEDLSDLCRYCDGYKIEQMIPEDLEGEERDEEHCRLSNESGLCCDCHKEEQSDFR